MIYPQRDPPSEGRTPVLARPWEWDRLSRGQLQSVLTTALLVHGRDPTELDRANAHLLYRFALQRLDVEARLGVLDTVTAAVQAGQAGIQAFFPVIAVERHGSLLTRSCATLACMAPLVDRDPRTGPRLVLSLLGPEHDDAARAHVFRAILLLGDRRAVRLVDGCWERLDRAGVVELAALRPGLLHAPVVEFFLDWLEYESAYGTAADFRFVAAALAALPGRVDHAAVVEIRRDFPVAAFSEFDGVRILRRWTIEAYGRAIADRVRDICDGAGDPQPLRLILDAWHVAPGRVASAPPPASPAAPQASHAPPSASPAPPLASPATTSSRPGAGDGARAGADERPPKVIPLGRTVRPARVYKEPPDVLAPGDLPQRLLLGDLDVESFASAGRHTWRARYMGACPDTFVDVSYSPEKRLRVKQTWRGVFGAMSFGCASWADVLRSGAGFSNAWNAPMERRLTGAYNLVYVHPPARTSDVAFLPDGAAKVIHVPLPLRHLASAPALLDALDRDSSIRAPLMASVTLGTSKVAYEERDTPVLIPRQPLEVFRWTVEQLGTVPSMPTSKTRADGARALIVDRLHYFLTVTCFFRDLERVVAVLATHGLVGRRQHREGHPHGTEFAALVLPALPLTEAVEFANPDRSIHVRYEGLPDAIRAAASPDVRPEPAALREAIRRALRLGPPAP